MIEMALVEFIELNAAYNLGIELPLIRNIIARDAELKDCTPELFLLCLKCYDESEQYMSWLHKNFFGRYKVMFNDRQVESIDVTAMCIVDAARIVRYVDHTELYRRFVRYFCDYREATLLRGSGWPVLSKKIQNQAQVIEPFRIDISVSDL